MAEGFGENVAPTAAIRAILNSYPFSIGLLREIIQNSDDARASKQVFVLDRRFHETDSLYHPYLAVTQGPALLAYNNELIRDDDWRALQNIHRSSKIADTSKIGKYGIGFRSCYHITDTPHILSGSYLALLDPKHDFAEFHGIKVGGLKLNIESDWEEFSDNITAFDAFLPRSERGKHFDGSIFRLPLRTSPGAISNQTVSPDEISDLLRDFAKEELNVSLLFLRNVTSIEIYEVDMAGNKMEIARASIDRTPLESFGDYEIHKATVRIHNHLDGSLDEGEWRVVHAPLSEAVAVETLSERLGGNPTAILSQHKLSPIMDFAIPLNRSGVARIGRLFTYLPLPLRTEFPVHINALFALTQSRQNLRNGGEIGIVKHSDDHALTEWNRLLFETYIPQVWGILLETLVKHDRIESIFDAWPRPQADVQSGDYMYWKDMTLHVAQQALELPVWPAFGEGRPSYHTITSFLLADEKTNDDILTALTHAGLLITRPPQYITNIICDDSSVKLLSPETVQRELLYFVSEVRELDDVDAKIILTYLLSTQDCRCITGLPLVPSIAGPRITLSLKNGSRMSYTLFDETEESLFSAYDDEAVPLRRVAQAVRKTLVTQGPKILNLARVDGPRLTSYLDASPYAFQSQGSATRNQIQWLNRFWDWVQRWMSDLTLCASYHLIPTTTGFECPTEAVFDPWSDDTLAEIFPLLEVPLVDPRLNKRARGALEYLYPSSDIHALLLALPSTITTKFSESQAEDFCAHLLRYLPSSFARCYEVSESPDLRSKLRSLPIYPVISPSYDGTHRTRRTYIAANSVVRGVHPFIVPIFPRVDSITYLDLQSIHHNILQYVDAHYTTPLSVTEMHELMLEHLCVQSLEMQVAFVKYLDSNSDIVSRGILSNLALTKFVPATDGSLQMPKDLVDPQVRLARLYPAPSSCLPDTSTSTLRTLARHVCELGLCIAALSKDIIQDRIRFISSGNCPKSEDLACNLINLITDTGFDCRHIFRTTSRLFLNLEWIPTPEGLKSPLQSRDSFSHLGRKNLFDTAFSMVVPGVRVSASLRRALKWDGEIDFEILSQQLTKVLESGTPPYEKVLQVVEELGNRNLLGSEIASLQKTLQDQRWIPTRNGTLETVRFALLGEEDLPAIGFHSVAHGLYHHPKARALLQEMGCKIRPSKATILERLQVLHSLGSEKVGDVSLNVIRLLGWLPSLLGKERANLFIPDTNNVLCPFDDLYFNDVGPSACLYDIGLNKLAHPRISAHLATKLGLKHLGLIGIHSRPDDDLDMEGDLDTIRDCLREYTDSQLLLEFFANASDAGATEFNILIDELTAPASALLSPRCREFNNVSSLVLHNDGVFTDDDFKGIMRTGIGGKSGRDDTIGRFGLGALTMFYITEFATIISQDQVLFLNPSKSHLPVDRVALLLPLSTVRRLYKDHLSPLIGLFGFEPPEDINEDYSYKGTIFRLPIRSKKQFIDVKPIFEQATPLEDLAFHFRPLSSKCLLFTSVIDIRFFIRQYRMPQLCWSVTASRDQPLQIKENLSALKITISSSDSQNNQEWQVLSYTVDELYLPLFIYTLQENFQLRFPLVVQLASCSTPGRRHSLFSTLPLPLSLDLPAHISGPFILSFERRSIRLNEREGPEATYNHWLLTTIIPMVYLHLLEDRASVSDNAVYWPGNIQIVPEDTYNDISTMIIDAVYQMAATSDNAVFRSKFQSFSLLPQETHLMFRLPRSVSKVFEMIMPSHVVQLPPSVVRRLQTVKGVRVSLVTQKYVHQQILQSYAQFSAPTLEFGELQELVDFLLGGPNPFQCLAGLQLLPLEDGSFVKFDHIANSCFYIAPSQVIEHTIFKPYRLVHHDFETAKVLDVDPHLNLQRVAGRNIGELLNDYVPISPILENANPVIQTWNTSFWKAFKSLDIQMTTIANYPLVPTLRPDQYLSPAHCKTSSVVLANFATQEWLSQSLFKMGFTIVNTASLPRQARSALSSPELAVGNVLALLFSRPESMVTLFDSLDTNLHLKFTSWLYSHFVGKKRGFFMKHVRYLTLPLWRTTNGSFSPASDIKMLPKGVTIESVAPFAPEAIVGHDTVLESMGIQSPPSLRSMLDIPAYLEPQLDDAYQILLRVLLTPSANSPSVPVPNSQRLMRESNTLYSSKDDLFLAAFGPNAEHFVLPSFRSFETTLEQFGFQRQRDLSISMFKNCVEGFQNSSSDHLRNRAATLFQVFSEDLPLRVRPNQSHQWRLFDDVRFIPRNATPQPLGYSNDAQYFAPHIQNLPDLVSPKELVREEFQTITWSQRALYDIQPDRRILMVHPTLSLPTAEEVVNHLAVLATQVALDYPKDSRVLDHIKQTYQWLNEHAEEAQYFLRQKEDLALFLNVEDPTSDTGDWVWKRGLHILLDTYDTGPLQYPRGFLTGFRSLLTAAGAVTIDYGPDIGIRGDQPTNGDRLLRLSNSFNQMRKDRMCTDVGFICFSPDDEPLYAHQGYLAASTDYFKELFTGTSREVRDASNTNPNLVPVPGFSRRCVEYALDYVYTTQVPNFKREDADIALALEMLVLTHKWAMYDAQLSLQDIIIKMKMVDPFNLDTVRATAQLSKSVELMNHCDTYEARNASLVLRAKKEGAVAIHN